MRINKYSINLNDKEVEEDTLCYDLNSILEEKGMSRKIVSLWRSVFKEGISDE